MGVGMKSRFGSIWPPGGAVKKFALSVFFLITSSALLAEPIDPYLTGPNPAPAIDNGGPVDYGAISVNDLERGVLEDNLNTTGVPFNRQNYLRDRRFKTVQAAATAEMGKGVAVATGAALMIAGIPMTASIIPQARVAGYALITKAALEFAQAGADGTAARDNEDRARYIAQDGSTGRQISGGLYPSGGLPDRIDTPELRAALAARGVDADSFIEDLLDGTLTSTRDVARAMGERSSFSPSAVQDADERAAARKNQIKKQMTESLVKKIETKYGTAAASRQLAGQAGSAEPTGSADTGRLALERQGVQTSAGAPLQGNGVSLTRSAGGVPGALGRGATLSAEDILRFRPAPSPARPAAPLESPRAEKELLARMSRSEREAFGISDGEFGDNIFQKAHRHYQNVIKGREAGDSST